MGVQVELSQDKVRGLSDYLQELLGQSYDRAMSLPGQFYTDSDWAMAETAKLFTGQWLCVGREEELPRVGSFVSLDLLDQPVVLIRGQDQQIRALSNLCRHKGTVIAEGVGNIKSLLCPYHHWAYDLQGKLVHAPHIRTEVTQSGNCDLPEFGCYQWQGFVFVCLNDDEAPAFPTLKALESRINDYHLEQMAIRYLKQEYWPINWKLLVENFMEGYHLTPLHGGTLHKVNPSRLCKHFEPGANFFGYEVGFAERVPEQSKGHSDLSETQLNTCVMFALTPNLLVGVGSDYSSFLCIQPVAATGVSIKMGLIFHGDNWTDREVESAVDLFNDTMQEDKDVLMRLQRGLSANHHLPGPLADKDYEGTVWDFIQYQARSMR